MQRHIICFMNNMLCSLSPPKRLFWPKQKGGCQVPTKHEQAPIVQQHERKTGMERGRILKFIFDYVICIFLGNQLACYEGFN